MKDIDMSEIWKAIDEFNGNYEVSNLGRVRSVWSFITKSNGIGYTRESRILRPALDMCGYKRIAVSFEGKLITRKVHRLVAQAFINNPNMKETVNHINGIKTDNRAVNLEWATNIENINHAIDKGLIKMEYSEEERRRSVNKVIKRGSLNGLSKLNESQVIQIRKKYKPTIYTRKMLADEFNVSVYAIKDIISRRSWKHV